MINDREDWTEMEYEKADIKKRMQYILNMRPVFNKEALFSDGTEYYTKGRRYSNDQIPYPEK
jgi:hypothetical protein